MSEHVESKIQVPPRYNFEPQGVEIHEPKSDVIGQVGSLVRYPSISEIDYESCYISIEGDNALDNPSYRDSAATFNLFPDLVPETVLKRIGRIIDFTIWYTAGSDTRRYFRFRTKNGITACNGPMNTNENNVIVPVYTSPGDFSVDFINELVTGIDLGCMAMFRFVSKKVLERYDLRLQV